MKNKLNFKLAFFGLWLALTLFIWIFTDLINLAIGGNTIAKIIALQTGLFILLMDNIFLAYIMVREGKLWR